MGVPACRGGSFAVELGAAQADPGAQESDSVSQDADPGARREANRLHKALEDTGITLDCVATDILGVSGRRMLEALIAGTTDAEVLADLAKGRLRAKIPALKPALEGRVDHPHAVWIGAILAHIDFLDEQIASLTETIGEQIAPSTPAAELLCTIPGVQRRTAEVIVSQIGVDMSVFPSAKHLASWAGQCPGNDQSAGRRRCGRTRKGSKWLDWALEEAAMATLPAKDVYLAAQYARLKPRRGHKKALGAVKHSTLVARWHMLTTGELSTDRGGDYFRRREPERHTKRLVKQLEALGHTVTLQEAPMAASASFSCQVWDDHLGRQGATRGIEMVWRTVRVGIAAAAMTTGFAGVAWAQYPGANGVIRYDTQPGLPAGSDSIDIYAVNPDGTGAHLLVPPDLTQSSSTTAPHSPRTAPGSGIPAAVMAAR